MFDSTNQGIFGGVQVASHDPVARSTVALVEGDGEQVCSGTLIAPNLVVTAAHCFTSFRPYYVSFGVEVAQKSFWTDNLSDRRKFPNFREILDYTLHPDYDRTVTSREAEEREPPHDLALVTIEDGAPPGFSPARVIAPASTLSPDITLAGFGAFPEYDPLDPAAPRLRKVDTFIGVFFQKSRLFGDGPNPGRGSCVRDSGGSVYVSTSARETPIVVGNVVSGPFDCSEGFGYNTDFRYYASWLDSASGGVLNLTSVNSRCNNGVIDAGETCDGDVVACSELDADYPAGSARCLSNCSGYDLRDCRASTSDCDECVDSACVGAEEDLSIPDNDRRGISATIDVGSACGSLENIRVFVDIDHTYRGDLRVELQSPEGTVRALHNGRGGSLDDLLIDEVIGDFRGEEPGGTFTLFVSDNAARDYGKLVSWSIQLL
jgi:hypothetical protein